MSMDELDILKKSWNRDAQFREVSEAEIYKMLHKKSSTTVKWILIVSILEVAFWTLLSLLGKTDDYFKGVDTPLIERVIDALSLVNYVVILGFIFVFYRNFRRISTTVSTRQLMTDILRTRKTVNYYVWYNLGMITLMLLLGFIVGFVYSPDVDLLREQMDGNPAVMWILGIFVVVCLGLFFGAAWLFYKLVYGFFLRRLLENYKELKKIDF